MISRRSTLFIAELYALFFSNYRKEFPNEFSITTLKNDDLWSFFYAKEYDEWFLNHIYHLSDDPNSLKEFILLLHTGETVLGAPVSNRKEERRKVGQECLRRLAQDLLEIVTQDSGEDEEDTDNLSQAGKDGSKELIAQLELDGFIYRDGHLYPIENAVIDVVEERIFLELLVDSIPLHDQNIIKHFIQESEKAYANNEWGHSISDARQFLEAILQQIANAHHLKTKKANLPSNIFSKPVKVREYLESEGLIDKPEQETISKVYGLMSNTGSHPNIAEKDQARLMRHLALTLSQFILLKFQGYLKNTP